MSKLRQCTNCNGVGKVWNPKSKKIDLSCIACYGKGYVVLP